MRIEISDISANNIIDYDHSNNSKKIEQLKIYYGDQKDYPNDLTCFYKFLSDKEIERSKRYKNLRDERVYVISHALLNKKISKLLNIDFNQLAINYFAHKKPFLENHRIDFNLSHSSDYFAFTISEYENIFVGIDIEEVRETLDIKPIMNNYFHKDEISYILNFNINNHTHHQKFYEIWTRKEAFLKMSGIGLFDKLSELDLSSGEREMLIRDNSFHTISRFSNAYIYTTNLFDNLVLSLSANCPVIIVSERCENF